MHPLFHLISDTKSTKESSMNTQLSFSMSFEGGSKTDGSGDDSTLHSALQNTLRNVTVARASYHAACANVDDALVEQRTSLGVYIDACKKYFDARDIHDATLDILHDKKHD